MTKFNTLQNSFISGKLPQRLSGRTDVKEYASSCEELTNFMVDVGGGAFKRPGTIKLDDYDKIRNTSEQLLIPYEVSDGTSYIISISLPYPEGEGVSLLADNIMQFSDSLVNNSLYNNLLDGQAIYYVDSTPTSGVSTGVYYIKKLGSRKFKLANSTTNFNAGTYITFSTGTHSGVEIYTVMEEAYTGSMTVAPRVTAFDSDGDPVLCTSYSYNSITGANTYVSAGIVLGFSITSGTTYFSFVTNKKRLPDLNYTQFGDIIVICSSVGDMEPVILYKDSAGGITMGAYISYTQEAINAQPFQPPNANEDILLNPSGTTSVQVLDAEDSSGTNIPYFTKYDWERYIKIRHASTVGVAEVSYGFGTDYGLGQTSGVFSFTPSGGDVDYAADTFDRSKMPSGFIPGWAPYEIVVTEDSEGTIPTGSGADIEAGQTLYTYNITATTFQVVRSPGSTTPIDLQAPSSSGNLYFYIKKCHRVQVSIKEDFGAATASNLFQKSLWSRNNKPFVSAYYQQRLMFLGCPESPITVAASYLGNPFYFDDGLLAIAGVDTDSDGQDDTPALNDPFTFDIATIKGSKIQWASAASNLYIGTDNKEYIVNGTDGLSWNNISIKNQTNRGGSAVQPVVYESGVFFVDKSRTNIYLFRYNDANGSYISQNLSVLFDRYTYTDDGGNTRKDRIAQLVYDDINSFLYILYESKTIRLFAIDSELGTRAISDLTFNNSERILGLCFLNRGDNSHMYFLHNRYVDQIPYAFLERQVYSFVGDTLDFDSSDDEDAIPYYMDMATIVTNSPADTTVSGLEDYEGQEVSIIADGVYVGEETVSSGEIELDTAASTILVGYKYTAYLKTTKIEAGGEEGSSQGDIKRIHRAMVRLYKTTKIAMGPDSDSTDEYTFDETVYTGDEVVDFPSSPDRQGQVYIKSDEPTPCNVLMISMKGVTYVT